MADKKPFRSGFVAIMGRPNVGKSSIMNAFVGEKVAIVSDRPQTTRNRIMGVVTQPDWQVVFVDTPGIHRPRTKLGEYMMKTAEQAMIGTDALLCVVDGQYIGATDIALLREWGQHKGYKILAINKIDLLGRERLLTDIAQVCELGFDEVVPISALTGEGMNTLMSLLVNALPEGPRYFPDDMFTDQPERFIAAEIIREKALLNLREEIPHGVGIEMLSMKKVRDDLCEIHANIYCEKQSHKSIIIGKQGAMLKKIGSEARADIEKLLGSRIMLQLWVKVREDWRNRMGDLRTLGYDQSEEM
ncbi:MAG: GTPase Era [Candidatus Fimadaptatus sp.]|jgi:GTP-binding protein Era